MATATAVFNGDDSFWAWTSLESRLSDAYASMGYQVAGLVVDRAIGGALFGVPYQAEVTLISPTLPTAKHALIQVFTTGIVQATGSGPIAIAIPALGDPSIVKPPDPVGNVTTWVGGILENLGVAADSAAKGANLIVIALAIGAVVVIYQIAKNPKLVKSLR